MATVDYSPLFNSLRNAGTNVANMALKSKLMDAEVVKAGLTRDQMLANTALANSKTKLYDQKYNWIQTAINDAVNGVSEGQPMPTDKFNRGNAAVWGKLDYPIQPIGNTGYVVNRATGEISGGDNPLASGNLELIRGKTRAQTALAEVNEAKARAGGFAPRSGTSGSRASTGRNPLDIYKKEVPFTDVYGNTTTRTSTDYDAYRAANARLIALGLDPNDFKNHVALMSGQLDGAATQANTQGAVPTLDMRPDSPTAGQVSLPRAPAGVDPMSVPEIQSKVKEAQEAVKAGDMTDEEFLTLLNQMGIQ